MAAFGKMLLSTFAGLSLMAPHGVVGLTLRPACSHNARSREADITAWYPRVSSSDNASAFGMGSAKMTHNNLGGLGPDDGDESMVISLASYHMRISVADGFYYLGDVSNNNFSNGLISVNVEAGVSTKLDVEVLSSFGVPIEMERLFMTVLDIDAGSVSGDGLNPQKFGGIEGASFTNISAYYMYDVAQIKAVTPTPSEIVLTANVTGSQADNPTSAWGLTYEQKMKVAMVEYQHVKNFSMTLTVKGEEGVMTGRNFLLAGLSELADAPFGPCGIAEHLEIGSSHVTKNNLAGTAPGPKLITFENAATIKGTSIDLVVSLVNTSTYTPTHVNKTGISGKLGQINMGANDSAAFTFHFYEIGTSTPVEIEGFFFTFYDIDQGEQGHEALTLLSGKGTYFLSTTTSLKTTANDNGSVTFTSTAFGTSGNNPKRMETADEDEAVTLYFPEAISSFTINYDTVSNAGRNFLFGGVSEMACPSA